MLTPFKHPPYAITHALHMGHEARVAEVTSPQLLRRPWGSSYCSLGPAELSYILAPATSNSPKIFSILSYLLQWHLLATAQANLISYYWAKQISLIMTQGVQYFISLSLTLSPSLWV